MAAFYLVGALLVVGLAVYLGVVLLKAERF
jgi:K+-transporting ATPase KdpF subunit